jgi:hypothetical protein
VSFVLPGKEVGAMGAQMNERTGLVGGLVLLALLALPVLVAVIAVANTATVIASVPGNAGTGSAADLGLLLLVGIVAAATTTIILAILGRRLLQ